MWGMRGGLRWHHKGEWLSICHIKARQLQGFKGGKRMLEMLEWQLECKLVQLNVRRAVRLWQLFRC